MKFIKSLIFIGISALSFLGNAKTNNQIQVRSELASPIILENSEEKNYLKVSLTGIEFDSSKRVPINLALVIDRSGSMSGDRIKKAREAAILAVNMLNNEDMLSIVAYDSDAKVIVPSSKVTNKQKIIRLINKHIVAGGGTALFAGLSKGINQVEKQLTKDKVNRIILLSDGQANIGPSSVGELSELAIIAAKKNIAITTLGIGSDYNEQLMSSIASYSDGNHVFIDDTAKLENVFVREFKDVMSAVAQDVIITIHLKDGVKPVRLLGRDGVIKDNQVIVKMNQLYSNQEKYLLLEVIPEKGKVGQNKTLAQIDLQYNNLLENKTENETQVVKIAYTDNQDVVNKAIVHEVVAESEIQKVALENEKALKLYNEGKLEEARQLLQENSKKLRDRADMLSEREPEVSSRLKEQMDKNNIMADAILTDDENTYRKKVTEKQYESKQNMKSVIKK
ncbi:vWA domain-containing protein [Gilliamella intestini]|uniref:Ca-activated chloride channel family protein n=1 Tax=Gilliamella intestini TaxID=1798183 RepID=A0A1C3ZWN5_9GAMM|nr:VWA domain-containing protein [Gilliamella intestini]SCB86824.1 Ca-activated chloride channel family protein [Gilliamella intestini]